jgi:hypothetical protein
MRRTRVFLSDPLESLDSGFDQNSPNGETHYDHPTKATFRMDCILLCPPQLGRS